MSFSFTFLGSGTSQGVPLIGKEYPPGFLANPKNWRTRPSIYVATEKVKLVVDTTPDSASNACAKKLTGSTRCSSRTRTPTTSWVWTIAVGSAICEATRRCRFTRARQPWCICGACSSTLSIKARGQKGYFIPEEHVITGPFEIGDLRITPLDLPHGRMTTTGFLFEQNGCKRLAYLSDCKEIPEVALEKIRGVEIAVLDALRYQPHPTHMCLDEALTAARRIGASRTFFHASHPRL